MHTYFMGCTVHIAWNVSDNLPFQWRRMVQEELILKQGVWLLGLDDQPVDVIIPIVPRIL